MIQTAVFGFNFIQVNTYVLYTESNDCVIVDPGCHSAEEFSVLDDFLVQNKLKPYSILLTHPHIDHIVGVQWVKEKYALPVMAHLKSLEILNQAEIYATNFGFTEFHSFLPDVYLNDNDVIYFGETSLKVLYTPGHAEGSICLFAEDDRLLLTGDVLFREGIGRTDLPTGNYSLLMKSIHEKLMVLPDETTVLPGHGDKTTIGYERINNPFFTR